jgi:hypothetical protein
VLNVPYLIKVAPFSITLSEKIVKKKRRILMIAFFNSFETELSFGAGT